MKHIHRIALLFALSASLAVAADKKPKEMKPKLVDAGTILVKDAFDKEVVDTKNKLRHALDNKYSFSALSADFSAWSKNVGAGMKFW